MPETGESTAWERQGTGDGTAIPDGPSASTGKARFPGTACERPASIGMSRPGAVLCCRAGHYPSRTGLSIEKCYSRRFFVPTDSMPSASGAHNW